MSFNEKDIANLLSILRKGRGNAQTASDIEEQLNKRFGIQKSGN